MAARMSVFCGWLIWLAAALAGLPAIADGQEFRVDTEVFYGQEKVPALETLTIFTSGVVYDFVLTEPREVAILDPQRGQFTLLDEARQIKAKVLTQDLMAFTLKLEMEAVKKSGSLWAFAAKPEFETTAEELTQNGQPRVRVKLSAKPMEYIAVGQRPESPQAVQQYRHFADWYARLNATRGNLPAGARLALNQALAERELLPLEITRITTPSNPLSKKTEVRTRHLVNWALAGEDRKKIDQASDWIAKFRQVSFDEYRQGPVNPPANKQVKR